jgi:hypothetical protein
VRDGGSALWTMKSSSTPADPFVAEFVGAQRSLAEAWDEASRHPPRLRVDALATTTASAARAEGRLEAISRVGILGEIHGTDRARQDRHRTAAGARATAVVPRARTARSTSTRVHQADQS